MKNKNLLYVPAMLLMVSCGGEASTDKAGGDNDSAAVAEVVYGPLKPSEEVRELTVFHHMTEVDTVADKSTVIRFVSEDYYQPFPTGILACHNLQIFSTSNMSGELPADISKFKNLTTLVLTNAEMTTLPESVRELQNLYAVSLEGCKNLDLNQALEVLKKCPNIQHLNLSNMGLKEVPASIGEFAALRHLSISGNEFVTMPDSFYALQNIEDISYSGSKTYDYNDFCNKAKAFPNLKTLSFQYCGFTALPAVLNEYPALATVHWREEWEGKDGDAIIATTEKENKKFPKLYVTWSSTGALFYDIY